MRRCSEILQWKPVFDAYSSYYDLLYQDKDYAAEAAYVLSAIRAHKPTMPNRYSARLRHGGPRDRPGETRHFRNRHRPKPIHARASQEASWMASPPAIRSRVEDRPRRPAIDSYRKEIRCGDFPYSM